jgi:hypothetical protein
LLAGVLDIASGGDEELRRGVLVGGGAGCGVDDRVHTRQARSAPMGSIAEQARRAAGCLDFAISADLLDPGPHQHLRALEVAAGAGDLPQQRY